MSNLTELLPAGGSGKTVDFVASGTLPNGKPVILKADGTVEVVAESGTAANIPASAESTFNTSMATDISVAFDPNTANKFVMAYQDHGNSRYGTAIVGTVSGTSITFGSKYVFVSGMAFYNTIVFDTTSAGTFIVLTSDASNSDYLKIRAGTVSGSSITFGGLYTASATSASYISAAFDPNTAGSFVFAYKDNMASNVGKIKVGTLSGTSLSFGAEYTYNTSTTNYNRVAFDPNTANKFVIAYADSSTHGTALVGTVSGTSLTFGSEYTFNSQNPFYISLAFDPSNTNQFVLAFNDATDWYGKAMVGTISGTSISFGTKVTFHSAGNAYEALAFDPNTANKFVIAYQDSSASDKAVVVVGTVSGTSLSFSSAFSINLTGSQYISAAFDPNTAGNFVVAYYDYGPAIDGETILGKLATTSTNLTTDNFLGTSTEAYVNADPATILLQGGISTNQSGLTIGSDYYVQGDGTLATTADTISVKLGKALSATSILLSGE